jgi:hypothetical protein
MALRRTTLTSAITASQLTFGVANASSDAYPGINAAPLGYQPMLIDDEVMFLVSVPAPNIITVRMRGSDGTEAVAHDIGSSVITSSQPYDFPALQPGMSTLRPVSAADVVTYGQTGVMTVPTEPMTIAYLAGTAAIAMTLGAPSLALNGIELQVTSQSAFGHTITVPGLTASTGLFYTGAAGSPYTIATFPAVAGAAINLIASNGAWNVVNSSITPVVFT